MLKQLNLREKDRLKTLSKGNKEKVQLILAMSRKAEIYFLDEPIGGVDPARDYILNTIILIIQDALVVQMQSYLIADIERVLDEADLIKSGSVVFHRSVDEIREDTEHKSVDELFREVFRC